MARIGIVHTSLNSLGGAEKLCIETIQSLKEAGYSVDLIVTQKTNPKRIKAIFGTFTYPDKEIVVQPSVRTYTIYSRFIQWLFRDFLCVSQLRNNYDLTINTKPLLPITFTDIMYMHFFSFPGSLEVYLERYKNTLMRIYKFPHDVIIKLSAEIFNNLKFKPVVLTNSRFSKQVIMEHLNITPSVLYPPVDVEKYLPLSNSKKRRNIILTISRIEEGKGLDIIPKLAKRVPNAKFIIIGSLSSDNYFRYFYKMIRNMGVADKIKIIPNASENIKAKILSKAKIFLHPMKYEHFGIAIVEAMASGLVPLVSKTGGPWTDIFNCKQGVYGYAYEEFDSCENFIIGLLKDNNLRREIMERAVKRSLNFSSKTFRGKLIDVVRKMLNNRVSG
jgi:glycosyltransferase involved in cell wall biosynthesis